MTKDQLGEWFKLTELNRRSIFTEISKKMSLPPAAIEKDWWVVRTLDLVFQTEIASHMSDKELYQQIVEHRRTITPLRGIDYANHVPSKINPIPPAEMLNAWRKDYELMQQSMIYKNSLPFDQLMDRLIELKRRINKMVLHNDGGTEIGFV